MENHWILIKQLVSKILPHISPSYNSPATDEQIDLLEKIVGREIPTSFKEYLRVLNGQNHNNFASKFLGYNCFYSIEEIIKTRETYLFLFEDEPEIDWINENKIHLTDFCLFIFAINFCKTKCCIYSFLCHFTRENRTSRYCS